MDTPKFVIVERGIVEGPRMERLTSAGERAARAFGLDPQIVEMRINGNTRVDEWHFPVFRPRDRGGDSIPEVIFCRRFCVATQSYAWAPSDHNPPCPDCPGDETETHDPGHTIRCGTCDRRVRFVG